MKVLFLEIDTETEWAVASLGPAFLAAYLRAHGHEASFARVSAQTSLDDLVALVRAESAALIGVSLTTRQWQDARRILAALRTRLDIPVVAGGLHPTFSPEEVLAQPGVDFICLGEGEAALLDLVRALEAGEPRSKMRIDNIWAKGGRKTGMRPPIEPIDSLPFLARDFLDERHGVVHLTTQRGCPFPCTYCGARMYDELYAGGPVKYGRRRSQENVIAELEAIQREEPINYVIFLDDTFTIHHPWVRELCKVYGERFRIPFSVHARVETMNRELIAELASAGCRHIVYGVESGSDRVRREIMKRFATNERFEEVFRWTRDEGILVTANYMLGMPGETRAEMMETIELHRRLAPDDFSYFVFYPFPGTHLFKLCREQGYLPADYLDRPANHRETILDLPDVSRAEIREIYDLWTQVRTAGALARQGDDLSSEAAHLTSDVIEHQASWG